MKKHLLFIISLIVLNIASGQAWIIMKKNISTPKNTPVQVFVLNVDWTAPEMIALYRYWTRTFPNAIEIKPFSKKYNCHGYAWHMSSLPIPMNDKVWMNAPNQLTYIFDFSYLFVNFPLEDIMVGDKVYYGGDDHSAVVSQIPVGAPTKFISKWGDKWLVEHDWNDSPYNSYPLSFYRFNNTSMQPLSSPTCVALSSTVDTCNPISSLSFNMEDIPFKNNSYTDSQILAYNSNVNNINDDVSIYTYNNQLHINEIMNLPVKILVFDIYGQNIFSCKVYNTHTTITLDKGNYYIVKIIWNSKILTKKVFLN
jgi:hypothetical protein